MSGLKGFLHYFFPFEFKKTKSLSKDASQPHWHKRRAENPFIDDTYGCLRRLDGPFSYQPRRVMFKDKPTIVLGFGVPVEKEPFIHYGDRLYHIKHSQLKKVKEEIYQATLRGYVHPQAQHYHATDEELRLISSDFIEKAATDIEKSIPNYRRLNPTARAIAIHLYLQTGGKLDTFPKFCSLINDGKYAAAAKEATIGEEIFSYVNPNILYHQAVRQNMNRDIKQKLSIMRDAFVSTTENATSRTSVSFKQNKQSSSFNRKDG